jgi:N-acylglucosamine 2-epimerase
MLKQFAGRYRQDLFESVIPFWMKHSIDREHGGYFTCLDRDGSIYDDRKYMWLNGRQVWTLSRLYNDVEKRPEWLEAARGGAEFLRLYARDPQGRCYFSLTRDGRPAAYQRKPYAAVFIMLGWLEYSKATGEEWARREAVGLFESIRKWIAHPALMDRPALTGAPAFSQLADVMVLISMALELAAIDPDPRYRAILRDLYAAAMRHLDPDRHVLLENVAPDGTRRPEMPEGRLVSPGHVVEVCWFLLHLLEVVPEAGRAADVLRILDAALHFGWDTDGGGGLLYFVDTNGRPPLQLEAGMKLWWPHTEAIYALVLAYTMTRDRKWLDWLEKVDEYTYRTFPDPEHGEWFGYCDRAGKPTHMLKGNSYKGCFHVPRALLFSIQRIERFGTMTGK